MVKNRGGENGIILPGGENGISPSLCLGIIRSGVPPGTVPGAYLSEFF